MSRQRGLFGLNGQGVGAAAEYREHRPQRSASQQASPSLASSTGSEERAPTELPPSYTDSADGSEISLSYRQHASSNEKGGSGEPQNLSEPELSDSDNDEDSLLSLSIEDDEQDWQLDEAVTPLDHAGLPSYEESEAMEGRHNTVDELVRDVLQSSLPADTSRAQPTTEEPLRIRERPHAPLPCPVILPQRRPRKKSRGFVRAYSPLLQDCGIDQDTFLRFLKNFHKSSQASPIFTAIEISAAISGFAPSVIASAVTTAVQAGAAAGAGVQARVRTNTFLDRMNEELFQPAGLYAMIMKYKSDVEVEQAASGPQGLLTNLVRAEKVDMSTDQIIMRYGRTTSDEGAGNSTQTLGSRLQDLRLASGTTRGIVELPEAAPLIFPELDKRIAEGSDTFKTKAKDAQKFMADYLDRRAQAQYAEQGPNSSLTLPESQRDCRSSIADYSYPMHSGGSVALVSGGKFTRGLDKHDRRRERRLEKDIRRVERGKELRHEGKKARKFGDNYRDNLHDRINDRLAGHRARLGGFGAGRGGGGLIGGLLQAAAEAHSGRGSSFPGSSKAGSSSGASQGLGNNYEDEDRVGEGEGSHFDGRAESASFGEWPPSSGGRRLRRPRGQRSRGGALGTVKRIMREDVLYLLIVNMPSDAELAEAWDVLERARGES